MARATVVGAGYVGLCTALALAERGHEVVVADVDGTRVERVQRGEAPFYEPEVAPLLQKHMRDGRLRATADLAAAVDGSHFVFLCVGTPAAPDGSVDLRQVRAAAAGIGAALGARGGLDTVVVTKSTVPPGTTRSVVVPELERASGRRAGEGFHVASAPEFLREGSAMRDALHPDRIVVGADEPRAAELLWRAYDGIDCPRVTVDTATAEMIKYAANAFLATKVQLSNELANVAERLGVDWYDVASGIGLDPRIGPQFLRAGVGFGGSCFPKDVSGLLAVARAAGAPSGTLEAVLRGNDEQPFVAVRMLAEELGSLVGVRVALLGLSFKPDTDDVRETRALPIYEALLKQGADVVVHDPRAAASFARLAPGCVIASTIEEALDGAEGCIVQTEWAEYRALDPEIFLRRMRKAVVVDGRRSFDAKRMLAAGIRYRAIGLGARR